VSAACNAESLAFFFYWGFIEQDHTILHWLIEILATW